MRRKLVVTAMIMALSVTLFTGCGSSEDIKDTMGKLDTVKDTDLRKDDNKKPEADTKADDKKQSEDKKEDTKKDDAKTDDKKSETADKKDDDRKTDDQTASTGNKPATSNDKKDQSGTSKPTETTKPSGSNGNTSKPSSDNGNKTESTKGCSHDWKPNYRTVTVKEAWSEQVQTKAAWDETITVKEAWSEQVCVKAAWDEQVQGGIIDQYNVCSCGFIARTEAEGQAHTLENLMNGNTSGHGSWNGKVVYGTQTIHHDAEYQTVNHPAETTTVHHDAEYKTVNHPAETKQEIAGYTCSKCGAKK